MGEKILEKYKDVLIDVVVNQAMGAAVTAAPWLAFPPLKWFASMLLRFGLGWCLDYTIIGVNFILIDWEKDSNLKAMREALGEIDTLPPEATHEQKEVIDAKIAEAARNLIRLNDRKRL